MNRTRKLMAFVALSAVLAVLAGGIDGGLGFLFGSCVMSVWYEVRKEERAKREGGE